jgi:hypothetical protein
MARWWEGYPWRMIQTNMREIDIVGLDAQRYVENLKSFHANSVMVSFGGTMANYLSKVEDHYVNPNVTHETNQELDKLVRLCHENGIKVIARTDFSKMHRSVFEKYPEWAYREGENLDVLDSNGYISTCQNGGFQKAFMDEVITEIIERFHVDGIYCNMSGFMVVDYNVKLHGPCQCDNCRTAFKNQFGMNLPKKDLPFANMADSVIQAYQKFKSMVTASQKKRISALIKSVNPDVAYCSVDYVRQESNTEIGRALPHWQYSAASNTRIIIGCGLGADNADVDFMAFSARGTSVTPALQEYRLWQALSNFGGADYFIMGRLDNKEDTSAYARVRKVFEYAYKNERILAHVKNLAKVLLVRDSYQIPNPEERGWIRLLTELHIPFGEVLTSSLGKRLSDGYSLIVLPEKGRLSPDICQALDDYVSSGGRLLISGKAPQGNGKPLTSLGLQSAGKTVEAEGANIRLSEDDKAIIPGLSDRGFIPLGKGYVSYVNARAKEFCPIMPPQRFGPPEVCFVNEEPTGLSGLLVNDFGKGRVVWLPWTPGTLYYTEGYDIWFCLAKGVLVDILGVEQISQSLNPMVEVTIGKTEEKTLIHFVNGTGHFGTSFFDPVPVSDVQVEIPWEYEDIRCDNLDEPGNVRFELINGTLKISIPRLGFHACVVITKLKSRN